MGQTTSLEKKEFTDADILIKKAPGELHRKLAKLGGKYKGKTGVEPNKPDLVVELLWSHPKLKPL